MRIATQAMIAVSVLLSGCTGPPQLPPYRLETVAGSLAAACPESASAADGAFVPGGIAIVRDQGHETVLTSIGKCLASVDTTDGSVSRLPAAGEFAATAVDASSSAVFLASRSTGVVEWLDPKTGKPLQILGGFQSPLGARMVPGDTAYVTEFDAGTIVRVRPTPESRPATIASGLAGPIDIVVTDPRTAFVLEMTAGRLTRIGLQSEDRKVLLKNLQRPLGLATLPDGRLVFVEAGLRRIVAVDVVKKRREVLFDNLPIGASGEASPAWYSALGVGADGVLYLLSDQQGALVKLRRSKP